MRSPTRNNARRMAVAATVVAVLAALVATPSVATANTTPIALPASSIVPTVLTAGNATKSSDLTLFTSGAEAYFWVNNFKKSTSSLTWKVSAATATSYSVTGLFSAPSGTVFTVADDVNGNSFSYTTPSSGWAHIIMGTITVPAGTSNIKLTRSTTTSTETDIKSLELLPSGSLTAYNTSVANARASGQWLTDAGYGIFLQYGGWGYPKSGNPKSLDAQACDFNIPNFINMVKSTGAGYVIWSYTWYTYEVDGPNDAIDTISGDTTHTASCDLDLQVAQALHAIGVKFILYYHMGHDTDPTWWSKQHFPTGHAQTGTGDMTAFNTNWTNIITWAGNHFGTNLDGWWFDDGSYYYPNDFAAMETAARAGNSSRIVSVNSWYGSRYTDYQDYSPGETCSNGTAAGSVNASGVYTSGPYTGLRAHCQLMLNQDWGVHAANTAISAPNVSTVTTAATNAKAAHTALSLNVMMWEDGTIDSATYQALQAVNHLFHPSATMVNDTSSQATYTGTWGYASNRTGSGDYNLDIHYTTTAGDKVSITFTGTGIDIIGPSGSGYSEATVTLDGVAKGTVSQGISTVYNAQQVTYSVRGLTSGSHTIVLTKTATGSYLQLDAFNTVNY